MVPPLGSVSYPLAGLDLSRGPSHLGRLGVWDTATGQELLTLKGHTAEVVGVCFSPDGRRLASASGDKTVRVWDVITGQESLTLKGHTHVVDSVAFSQDGRRLASASKDGTVKVWDAATGHELLALKGYTGYVYGVAFSPDGHRLASATDDSVRVWDAATGQELLTRKGADIEGAFALAFSPAGPRLASRARGGSVEVWDATTGQLALTLRGHTDEVRGVAFSADGLRLASASQDETVKVWDAATGQELLTLKGHTVGVSSVAFSPDGRRLASGSSDGTVKVWDGTELTRQRLIEREARGLVRFLCTKSLSPNEVAGAVRRDPTITEAVRQQALAWVQPLWRSHVQAESSRLVESLFAKLLLRSEVLATLRADARLSEAVRQGALALAETFSESSDAVALTNASWMVVCEPSAGPAAYQRALRQAQAASRLAPRHADVLNTLGVAYYRIGMYQEALDTLGRSDKLRKESIPDDLAFRAMAHHQLGHKEQAQATLARLRETMKKAEWAKNAQAQGFLREAAALIQGTTAP
jgi:DNA-binding beta-propeller fold protein YncE